MGKRPNHYGREPAAKRRRMGSVDRAQQDEIDRIQALFAPEPKQFNFTSVDDKRPNVFGSIGAADGPQVLLPWDNILRGVDRDQRVGQEIRIRDFTLSLGIRWNSLYSAGNVHRAIVKQRLRVDCLWYRNTLPANGFAGNTMPEPWKIKQIFAAHPVYGKEQYIWRTGLNTSTDFANTDFRFAKSFTVNPPSACRPPKMTKSDIRGLKVMLNNTSGVSPGATTTVATQVDMSDDQLLAYDARDSVAQVTMHTFRFPLPKDGWKAKYDEQGPDHIMDAWVPMFFWSWYGETTDGNGDTTHIPNNANIGQLYQEFMQYRIGYIDA